MLTLRGVRFRYPGAREDALADVDLDVADGTTVAVLGASGCGKSTLLRVVAGLLRHDDGVIRLDGDDISDVPAHRRRFGMLFQDYALFPHLDVAGNVAYGLKIRGEDRAEIERRVADALVSVGLEGTGSRAVSTLSGGEAQRVALARALAVDPPLLLLDEPLGALDRPRREELLRRFGDVFRDRCVLYVTHDPTEALAVADVVAVMRHGRFAQIGPPAAVWTSPADEHVARLIGFDDIVDATLVRGSAGATLETAWGPIPAPETSLPDGPVRIVLRPDAWRVSPEVDSSRDNGGLVDGVIVDDRFAGDHRTVTVRCGLTSPVTVRIDVSSPLHTGSAVSLSVDVAGLIVVAGDSGG